jgi:O-antigen/teichoic acid export membrane protein
MTTSVHNRLLAEGVGYTVVDALQQALALAAMPIVLLLIDPAEFGQVTWGLVWMQLALAAGGLGLDFALLRHFDRLPEQSQPGTSARVLSLSAIAAATAGVLVVLGSLLLPADRGTVRMLWAGTAIGLILAVRGVPLAVLRARRDVRRYAVLLLGGAVLQAIGQVGGALVRPDAAGYMTGYALATAAGLAWALVVTRGTFAWREFGRWPEATLVRYAMTVLPSTLFNRVLASADRFALFQMQDLATLGTYGLAARLALPLKMVSGGFKTALAPALGDAERQGEGLGAVLLPFGAFVTRLLICGAALLLLGLELLALTPWGGQTAAKVEALLALLLVAQVAAALAALLQTVVYYSPRPGRAGTAGAASAVVLLAAIAVLVPHHGAIGAAIAQILASWVALGMQTRWLGDIPRMRSHILLWTLASVAPVLIVAAGRLAGPGPLLWGKILFACLAVGALASDLRKGRGFLRPTSG